jgi:hypothetical protein
MPKRIVPPVSCGRGRSGKTRRLGSNNEDTTLVVNGFVEPITKEIPLEYAVELNRLIELQMEGSIG